MPRTRNSDAYYDEEDDGRRDRVIPDGGSVSVPLELCDSNTQRGIAALNACYGRRPGFAKPAAPHLEQMRRDSRQCFIDRATSAWMGRDQKPEPPDENNDDPDEDIDDRARAYRDMVRRSTNAWKTRTPLVTGWNSSAAGPGPAFTGTGRPTPGENRDSRRLLTRDEATSMKNAAYAEYCNRVYNAWRGGR